MKTNVFEIIADKKPENLYTHSLKFKGKLLSGEGLYSKNYFIVENPVDIKRKDFLSLKVSDIPDYFHLAIDLPLHKEFPFYSFEKKEDEIEINISATEIEFEDSIWNYRAFFQRLTLANEYGFKPFISSDGACMELKRTFKVKASDTMQAIFDLVQKDFAKLYEHVHIELLEKATKHLQ